ncbi:STAS domain-containing protein [Variovorax sp. ZT4R33]|uniref:STAS domain-containing protein n=1 Tax=Variovorax sp. ZT4R33 TaxID=3443743 RepID=UPI003F4585F9
MSKEEQSGRLLSKVAKFVRNPLKDWAELDAQDSAATENGYSREMLKEMIERRQRNDFVRRREFDMLRKLRQREAAGVRDPGQPSSLNISSTSGRTEGRALTLKKIDEIEEQMSKQWWKGAPTTTPGDDEPSVDPEILAAQRARAYADTAPQVADSTVPAVPPEMLAGPAEPAGAAATPLLVYDSALDEAAIRFAHGDDAGAESILLQSLLSDASQNDHNDIWLALLDLYRAIGDAEKFVAASTRYAQRMKRNGPEWVSLRALARGVQTSVAATGQHSADWRSPAQLNREGLVELTRALGGAGAVWTLDWRLLASIDLSAAGPLKSLFAHWSGAPVDVRFLGAGRLLAVLEKATPSNDRGVDEAWWQLRMAALRLMNEVDLFELVALNYCITYEVSPPPWQEPQGRYAAVEPPAASGTGGFSISAGGNTPASSPAAPETLGATLAGDLSGESESTWRRLDAEIADAEMADASAPATIACGALVRLDLAAAGTLLQWVTERDANGQRVQFVDAHRLIAAFFKVVGIADHALVRVRD